METIEAGWQAPGARALTTTRRGGLDLSLHPADRSAAAGNRRRLSRRAGVDAIQWMEQRHGIDVLEATTETARTIPAVDAVWTREPGLALAVLTADCAPLVLYGRDTYAEVVGAAHCGWRGTVAGIVEATVAGLPVAPGRLTAWIGPTICQRCYEIDRPVEELLSPAERAAVLTPGRQDHWWMDLGGLVALRLRRAGVGGVTRAALCTSHDAGFYSHRGRGDGGRMATLVWRERN